MFWGLTILRQALHDCSNDHDRRPQDNTLPPSQMIRHDCDKRDTGDGAEIVACDKQSELASFRVVEVFLPVVESLH
jgi:hypothetical protein